MKARLENNFAEIERDPNSEEAITARNELERACAEGFFLACHKLGFKYHIGAGVGKSDKTARTCFEKSAAMGYGESMLYLGDIYWIGGDGVDADRKTAVDWYKRACEKNNSSDDSLNRIGKFYSNSGKYSEALEWWRLGESKNYPACTANLGLAYRFGKGVKADWKKAKELGYKK